MPLAPGTRLGPYEIVAAIGAGGMGEVYRARDARLGREVAIKVVQTAASGAVWERFEREARAASALNHPHICSVFDVGESEGQPYLVMELLDGKTLRDYIGRQPLETQAAIAIATQIADALEAAHAKGIIHRDIKPGNVMITGRRHAKVLDFGLAKHVALAEADETRTLESLTCTGTVVGTPHYLPPEVLQGAAADARGDAWALGIVMYEMLTGRLPFGGTTAFDVSSAILRESVPPLPASVPAALRTVVERCLAKRPEERYRDGGEVREALEALPAAATPKLAAPERRRWIPVASALLAVALAITGAVLWRGESGPNGQQKLTVTGGPASPNQEATALFNLAVQYLIVENNVPKGLATFERVLALDPHFAEALRYHAFTSVIGMLNGYTNDTSLPYKAEQELRQAAREDPDLISLPSALAAVYMVQGRKDLVPWDELERVRREHPEQLDTRVWLLLLRMLSEENTAAKDLALGILEEDSLNGAARMFLGEILRTEGDAGGAIREQQRLLETAPDNITSIRFLALAYMDNGEWEKARSLLEEKRPLFAENYFWRLTWAQLLAAQGRRDEAVKAMDEDTLRFAGAVWWGTLGAAEFYSELGETSKALDWLERAIERGDDRAGWFRRDPQLANIREEPRFLSMIESIEARRK